MSTITVINENGKRVQREVTSRQATIVTDENEFTPTVVQRVEYDSEGEMSQITTVCGETENRRESNKGPDLTVEGVVGGSELESLKSLDEGESITLVSDIDTNQVEIKRVTIEQTADLVHITPDGGEQELAFSFQLQLKHPEA